MSKDSGIAIALSVVGGFLFGMVVCASLPENVLGGNLLSGLIGAMLGGVLSLAGSWFSTLNQNKIIAQEKEEQNGRLLRALFVEVSARAVRCARDCNTWRVEADLERKVGPEGRQWRGMIEVMKFAPSPLVVYPSLGGLHGALPSDVEVALSDFHYRMDAIHRDFDRFGRKNCDDVFKGEGVFHLAGVFWDACESAKKALDALSPNIDGVGNLRDNLNQNYERMLKEPGKGSTTTWSTIEEALNGEIGAKRPKR